MTQTKRKKPKFHIGQVVLTSIGYAQIITIVTDGDDNGDLFEARASDKGSGQFVELERPLTKLERQI